jgi:predicted P-loop ATPase/GTPase
MKKQDEILRQQEIIKCYEAIANNSDKLIQAQKEKIEILEEQVKIHKEAVEKLSEMLDETIKIADRISKISILPKITFN